MKSSRRHGVLPGFGPALGVTLLYVGLLVLVPLAALFVKTAGLTFPEFWHIVTAPRALAAYRLSFGTALLAALLNAGFGLLLAWVLARYRFPGRAFVDALVDLPFALPTAVAGLTLTAVYSANGWFGRFLEPHGLRVAFSPLGIVLALTFVGLPFVVRAVQPVLEDLDAELEEAAAVLGASRLQTFRRIVFPQSIRVILPPMTNDFIALFKDTSIVSVISVVELSKQYQTLTKNYGGFLQIGLTTAALYLVMSVPLGYLSRWLEQRWGGK